MREQGPSPQSRSASFLCEHIISTYSFHTKCKIKCILQLLLLLLQVMHNYCNLEQKPSTDTYTDILSSCMMEDFDQFDCLHFFANVL